MRYAASNAWRSVAAMLLVGVATAGVRAETDADDAQETPRDAGRDGARRGLGRWLARRPDAFRASLTESFLGITDRLDRWFGQDRLVDEQAQSRLLLSTWLQQSRFGGTVLRARARAHGMLPRTRRRLALILDQESTIEDPARARQVVDAFEESRPDVGLRAWLMRSVRSLLTLDAGVRGTSPLQAFARLRASRTLVAGPETELRLQQTVAVFSADRWVGATELRWRGRGPGRWLGEILTLGTWREAQPGVEPALVLSLMRETAGEGALRLDAGGVWPEVPHCRSAEYFVRGARRARLGRPWLFGELRLGVGFPQDRDYAPDPSVAILLEMALGAP